MKKLFTMIAVVLMTMVFAAVAVAKTPAEAPESITIDGAQNKQPAVVFPHKVHMELAKCETCHHTQKGLAKDSKVEVETCTSCHLNPKDAATPDMAQMSLKKNPFHMGCIDCHKEQKKGPVKCNECHKK